MFAKAYKLKSNNTLKNSEKKYLAQRIQDEFPGVLEGKVKELVPVKSNSSCMKLILHSGDTVGVYVVDGFPMMIETGDSLVPTVCALWKVPELLPTLIVHSPVLPKVAGGAPLYLPGVVRGSVPQFRRGALVAACTQDNAAAGIVGRATISIQDMQYMAAGVCLEAIHVYGDLLSKDPKFSKIERPKLGLASYPSDVTENLATDLSQLSVQPEREEWPSLVKPAHNAPRLIADAAPSQPVSAQAQDALDDTTVTENSVMEEEEEDPIPTDMDGLLRWCLLSFLKLDGKQLELPLKTNLLYKNYLMPLCPSDRTLDVKKSSYKKMGKFLEAMQQEGLVEVREIEKGVDAIVAVSLAHPLVRGHVAPAREQKLAAAAPAHAHAQYAPPQVREMFCVTAHVAPLMPQHRKGTALTASDVRACVTEYVRARSLTAPKGGVILDATLAKILGKPEQDEVKWDAVMSGVQAKLTASTEMRFADGSSALSKARLEPVTMHVATRSGNKKVTLVSNLEAFGFHLPSLAQACQQGVAAACGVTRAPGARHDQLMLQGDQTYFIAKLLIEKYGLPKKFVEGADKALKKKK